MKLFATLFLFASSLLLSAQALESSNLPIVIVDTEGEIVDEPKVRGTMKIIDNGENQLNSINDEPNGYDGAIGIELRGQTSQQIFEKKSFGLELWDENDNDIDAEILGMPAEEDWILYGPYSDKSLIRNYLSFNLWSRLNRYGSRTVLCELVLNGDYHGVYVVMEKIKRDDNRVDISTLNEDENEGDDLTGGYIIKIDKTNNGEYIRGWNSAHAPPNRAYDGQQVFFMVEEPDPADITDIQFDYIKTYVDAFEDALAIELLSAGSTGFEHLIDVNSFIDYSLLCELNRNVDSYRLSTYLYKDKDSKGGKLSMGPPWDYNLSFGNADYCDGGSTEGWAWDFNKVCNEDYWLNPFWWNKLIRNSSYISQLKARWAELRTTVWSNEAIGAIINDAAEKLEEPAARNFERWPVLGTYVWPNNHVGNTYASEINYLENWIADRIAWMDEAINNMNPLPTSTTDPALWSVYPNPTTDLVKVKTDSPIMEYFLYSIDGSLLRHQQNLKSPEIDFSLAEFEHGKYLIRVVTEKGSFSRLLLKQ